MKQSNDTDIPRPSVTIDRLVLERVRRYVSKCDTEVSGFGFAVMEGSNLHIDDIRVVKQDSVSGGHTDINKDALNKLMHEWRGRDGVLVWWHSHVNMSAFWSGTDVNTIKELGKNGMCLAVVFNKKNEHRCAIAFKADLPFRKEPSVIMLDNLSFGATLDMPAEVLAAWDKELADSLPPPVSYVGGRSWGWDNESGTYVDSNGAARSGVDQSSFWSDDQFWETREEGEKNDCDWTFGSHFSQTKSKWRKSFKQKEKERLAANAGGKSIITAGAGCGSPSATQDSLHEARRKFALEDDDIITYLPVSDQFELLNGIKVNAEWYISNARDRDNPAINSITGMSEADLDDLYEQIEAENAVQNARA